MDTHARPDGGKCQVSVTTLQRCLPRLGEPSSTYGVTRDALTGTRPTATPAHVPHASTAAFGYSVEGREGSAGAASCPQVGDSSLECIM